MNTTSQPSLLGHCWRLVGRIVRVMVALVGLVTMFYVLENWRGRRAWENYQAEMTARGEGFGLTAYASAPVPAEQNFAGTPVLQATVYSIRGDTNLIGRFKAVRGSLTNFAEGTEPVRKEDAGKVLGAFRGIEAEMAELRAATKRPYAQSTMSNDNVYTTPRPSFSMLRTLGQLFTIHASAELAAGHSDRALADLAVVQHLADALGGRASLTEAMIRVALLEMTLPPLAEGLASGAWSNAELVTFQKSFESQELLTGLDAALRGGERNSLTHLVAEEPRAVLADVMRSFGMLDRKTYFLRLAVDWCPQGWFYQNAVHYSRVMERQFDGYDVNRQRVFPERCAPAGAFLVEEEKVRSPFNYLAVRGVPNFTRCTQGTAQCQAYLREAALACALERYRRARVEYPETLTALVPQFIARLPNDLMTGEGLKYKRGDAGKFSLYSVGWNLKDDGGTTTKDRMAGDWVWPPAKLL